MIQWQDNGTIRKVRALLDGDEETLFSWRMVAPHDEDESEPEDPCSQPSTALQALTDGDAEHAGPQPSTTLEELAGMDAVSSGTQPSTTLKELADGDAEHPGTQSTTLKERAEGDAGHPGTQASKILPHGMKMLKGMKEGGDAGAPGSQARSDTCGNSDHRKKNAAHCKADESPWKAEWWQLSWGWKW